jgi:hypothetical protein
VHLHGFELGELDAEPAELAPDLFVATERQLG